MKNNKKANKMNPNAPWVKVRNAKLSYFFGL